MDLIFNNFTDSFKVFRNSRTLLQVNVYQNYIVIP
jgi:hypothetical protein